MGKQFRCGTQQGGNVVNDYIWKFLMGIDELRQNAILFWPPVLRAEVAELSILPHLLQTQELFISTLNLAGKSPVAWQSILEASGQLPANLFLKHLMVLSDLGRETLSKIVPLTEHFPDEAMRYVWREAQYTLDQGLFTDACNGRRYYAFIAWRDLHR